MPATGGSPATDRRTAPRFKWVLAAFRHGPPAPSLPNRFLYRRCLGRRVAVRPKSGRSVGWPQRPSDLLRWRRSIPRPSGIPKSKPVQQATPSMHSPGAASRAGHGSRTSRRGVQGRIMNPPRSDSWGFESQTKRHKPRRATGYIRVDRRSLTRRCVERSPFRETGGPNRRLRSKRS